MTVNRRLIADTALRLLDRVGLDGLTMRLLAAELGVRAPTLYWHLKNKRELLDAMAETMFLASIDPTGEPDPSTDWRQWMVHRAHRLRAVLVSHRDGARVMAGTHVDHPDMYRSVERTLSVLCGNGFTPQAAGRALTTLHHFTIGFVIEEQARTGVDYPVNPYTADGVDPTRHPLLAELSRALSSDMDAEFDAGLTMLLNGMAVESTGARSDRNR